MFQTQPKKKIVKKKKNFLVITPVVEENAVEWSREEEDNESKEIVSYMPVPLITENGIKELGKLIKYWRNFHGWSMDRLCEEAAKRHLEVSKSSISNIERGNGEPKYNTLAKLISINFIGIPGDDISIMLLYEVLTEQATVDALGQVHRKK